MLMKYLSLALCGAIGFLDWLGRDYYKAVRHEFYQVWDTIDEMRGTTE